MQEIFVAVIIDNFKRLKSISNGSAFMTAQQREWVRLQRTIRTRQPRIQAAPTRDRWLQFHAYRLVTHRYFEPCVVLAVALNVAGMLTYHYPQSRAWVRAQWTVDSVFTFVYLAEAILRVAAHGLHGYLTGAFSLWHPYDALLATWGLFVFCLGPIAQASAFCLITLRLGRTLRLFRVIRFSSHLKRLCLTFYYSLPSLKNIGMFLLLIYYVYAVGGMHLFSTLPFGTFINEDANFSSFGLSLLTLVRCTAGEDWNGLMHEADGAAAGTRGKMAVLYFCSFIVLIYYVALNLFIATMLENFQEDMVSVGGLVTTKHIRRFSKLWTELKTKSLHGDLTKINNRAVHVATPTHGLRKSKSAFRLLPAASVAAAPGTKRESTGGGGGGATVIPVLSAASSRRSLRRISIRERLGGAFARSVSSGKMLAAAAAVARQQKAGAAEEAEGHEVGAAGTGARQRSPTAARPGGPGPGPGPGQGSSRPPLGEEETALVFRRLYESSPRYLPIQYLKEFVVGLPPPLGPRGCAASAGAPEQAPLTAVRVLEYIRSLEAPVNQYGYVYYQDVLQAVLRRAFELQTQIPQAMRAPFKNKQVFLAHEWYAAVAVQSAWRGRALRSKLRTTTANPSSSPALPRRAPSPLHQSQHQQHQQQPPPSRRSSSASAAGGLGASVSGSHHLRISISGGGGGIGASRTGWDEAIASGTGGSSPAARTAASPSNASAPLGSGGGRGTSPKAVIVGGGDAPPPIALPPPPASPSHRQRRPTSVGSYATATASRASSLASVGDVPTSPRSAASSSSFTARGEDGGAPSIVLDNSRRRPSSIHNGVLLDPPPPPLPPAMEEQAGRGDGAAAAATSQEEVLERMLALAKLGDELLLAAPMPLRGGEKAAAGGPGGEEEEVELELMELLAKQQEQAILESAAPLEDEDEDDDDDDAAAGIRRRAESI